MHHLESGLELFVNQEQEAENSETRLTKTNSLETKLLPSGLHNLHGWIVINIDKDYNQ